MSDFEYTGRKGERIYGAIAAQMCEKDKRIAELEGDLKWSEELADRRLQDVRNRDKGIAELEAQLRSIRKGHTKTVEYDLSPAMVESALRDKLIELGWTPPVLNGEET